MNGYVKQKHLIYEYPTITEMLDRTSIDRHDQLLFIEEKRNGRQVTVGRWRQDLLETAGRFQRHNAKHIGVVCDLTYECILCMYGAIMAGKVLVPLEGDLSGDALDWYVKKADVELLLYHDGMIDGDVTGCESMQMPDFLAIYAEPLPQWPAWNGDREACIFFTSGTEGEPRGVQLTQRNLAFLHSYSSYKNYERSPRVLVFLPIHHVLSFAVLTVSIHDGCEIYLSRSIKYVAQEMQKIQPDILISVPMVNELFYSKVSNGIKDSGMWDKVYGLVRISNALRKIGIDLRQQLFRKLRDSFGGIPQLIISGGSAASEETIKFFDDFGILLFQAYGLTETAAYVSANSKDYNRIGSVGQSFGFNQVRIKDGEIQVRGGNVMKGYYKDLQATERAFDGDWFKTGDFGHFDKDGYLYITGRKKNLIILDSGENVSPEELEKQLVSDPYISEVVVREKNKRIHAEVIAAHVPGIGDEEIKRAIQGTIDALNLKNPVYKRIVSWELRKEPFDKTSSLKIRR